MLPSGAVSDVRFEAASLGVGVREAEARQIRVLRAGPDQPSHVVVGESVRPGRIAHLLHLARKIVGILDGSRVRIGLRTQPVEGVVDVLNRLILAVGPRFERVATRPSLRLALRKQNPST